MTTTREAIEEKPNGELVDLTLSFYVKAVMCNDEKYYAEYKLHRAELERRLLALTSSGEVTDEEKQAEAAMRYPFGDFMDDARNPRRIEIEQRRIDWADGARWLRSKGKVRVPTSDEIKNEITLFHDLVNPEYCDGFSDGCSWHAARVIELNQPKQTAQDGG